MENMIKLNYFYGDEPDRLCFYRIPKVLYTKAYFSGLSSDAKVLYGLMLDMMSMSRENRWVDNENRVYIFYSVKRACAFLGCKKDKAMKLFAELDTENGIGLIERVKRGQGKSDLIYVKSFELPENAEDRDEIKKLNDDRSKLHNNMTPVSEKEIVDNSSDEAVGKIDQSEKATTSIAEKVVDKTDRSEIQTSRYLKNPSQEVGETAPNKNNYNNTDMSYNSPVQSCHITEDDDWLDHIDCSKPFRVTGYYPELQGQDRQDPIQPNKADYIEYLRDCVGYDGMIREDMYRFEKDKIDGIINLIADIATTTPPDGKEWVNSRPYSHEVVKSRLLKIDRLILEHVLDRMKENTTKIRNMRSYLLTALYNAWDEMKMSVDSQVNYDWYGGGMEKKGVAYACNHFQKYIQSWFRNGQKKTGI